MIKLKSIYLFFLTNISLISFSFFCYYFSNYLFITSLIKNYLFILLINYFLKGKQWINNNCRSPKEKYKGEFHINVIISTIIESISLYFIGSYFCIHKVNLITDIIYFIPKSFLFELIFDFFHYWTHRYVHHNKFLYKHSHKKHHLHSHPISILTFYQNPFDILFTNVLPVFITLYILSHLFTFSYFLFILINTFKTYIEISGHCGKQINNSSSFSQFVWLPRMFNIQLYTKDHDLHHTSNNCNYGKRFILYDKFFNTFKQ